MQRRPFFRQRSFYGGILTGIIVVPLFFISFNQILLHIRNTSHHAPQVTSGNMIISLNDDLMTTGMTLALQRIQKQSRFTVAHLTVTTQKGDSIQMNADGTLNQVPVIGSVPGTLSVTMNPVIDSTGHIDFQITQLSVIGIDASLWGLANTLIEQTLNDQFSDLGQGSVLKGLDYQLLNVHTENGALVVTAKLSPVATPTSA